MQLLVSSNNKIVKITLVLTIALVLLFDIMPSRADKGRDIIIYNGKVILKGGKKKGNIIISGGESHGGHEPQGNYKYKKKYMNYGGFWR